MDVLKPAAFSEVEVYEFLISSPTPQEILEFRPSETVQDRIRRLLAANKIGELSTKETLELEEFNRVEHFVRMLKIHAQAKLI
jgi:hypothetical protein